MKISVNITTFIILFALFNCTPDTELPAPEVEFNKQIKFFTTVSLWNQPTVFNEEDTNEKKRTYYSSKGVSYAKKLTNYELKMSHIIRQLLSGESLKLEDGKFEILGEEGHSIFGSHTGYGKLSQNNLHLNVLLSISGGTGYYKNARGYLEMKTKITESQSLQIEVKGYIMR